MCKRNFCKRILMAFLACFFGIVMSAQAKTSIKVWDWFKGSQSGQGKFVEALDKAFMEKYPNIIVNHEGQSNKPYDIYQAAFIAKEGPDVMLMHANGQRFQDYAEALTDLTPYIQDMIDNFPPSVLADTSPERDLSQGIMGLPVTVQGWVWYYNKKLFTQAGLNPDEKIRTWDQFLNACEKLKAAGITPLAFGKGIHLEWMIAGTLDQVLSPDQKRGLLSGDFPFTSPIVVKTFEKFRILWERGFMDKAGLTEPLLWETGKKFKAGKAAIMRGLVSDIYNWGDFGEALGPENLGVFPNFYFAGAHYPEAIGVAGGIAYAIPKYSKNKEAAIKYAKFVASADGSSMLTKVTAGVPATNQGDRSNINATGLEVIRMVANQTVPATKAFTPSPCWNVLRSHAPLMITGQITPQQFGEEIEKARD
jgi:raffinose/stachyose/melibiose transport system substrate-binding protein